MKEVRASTLDLWHDLDDKLEVGGGGRGKRASAPVRSSVMAIRWILPTRSATDPALLAAKDKYQDPNYGADEGKFHSHFHFGSLAAPGRASRDSMTIRVSRSSRGAGELMSFRRQSRVTVAGPPEAAEAEEEVEENRRVDRPPPRRLSADGPPPRRLTLGAKAPSSMSDIAEESSGQVTTSPSASRSGGSSRRVTLPPTAIAEAPETAMVVANGDTEGGADGGAEGGAPESLTPQSPPKPPPMVPAGWQGSQYKLGACTTRHTLTVPALAIHRTHLCHTPCPPFPYTVPLPHTVPALATCI